MVAQSLGRFKLYAGFFLLFGIDRRDRPVWGGRPGRLRDRALRERAGRPGGSGPESVGVGMERRADPRTVRGDAIDSTSPRRERSPDCPAVRVNQESPRCVPQSRDLDGGQRNPHRGPEAMGATFSGRPSTAGPRYVFSPAVTTVRSEPLSRFSALLRCHHGKLIHYPVNRRHVRRTEPVFPRAR